MNSCTLLFGELAGLHTEWSREPKRKFSMQLILLVRWSLNVGEEIRWPRVGKEKLAAKRREGDHNEPQKLLKLSEKNQTTPTLRTAKNLSFNFFGLAVYGLFCPVFRMFFMHLQRGESAGESGNNQFAAEKNNNDRDARGDKPIRQKNGQKNRKKVKN